MTQSGLPDSIPRRRVEQAIESLGIPLKDLLSLTLHVNVIVAEFVTLGEDGRKRLNDDGSLVTHTIDIPIVGGG